MTRLQISQAMEWLRPLGIAACFFIAYWHSGDPIQIFHILGLGVTMIMSGSVALEGLLLKGAGSEKVGYRFDRGYQIQSALNNLATALVALFLFFAHWGPHADAAVTLVMLCFFCLSAINHASSIFSTGNRSVVNFLRPFLTVLLAASVLVPLLRALG